jgi:predicted phage terminase large subunit-like protein
VIASKACLQGQAFFFIRLISLGGEMSRIELHRQYAQVLYPNSFRHFLKGCFQIVSPLAVYEHNWHIDAMSEYITACVNKDITRLIINIPPRSLKSITCSIALPAWVLGRDPREQIIVSSYARSLSNKLSQDTRNVMQSKWYQEIFPNTIIAKDQNEKSKFMTTLRGHRMAVSVGSAVTGEGGNILIIDDPTNPMQALSDAERTRANEWFSGTFYPRLNDKRPKGGVIILIMQRLHQNDLTGYLIEQEGFEHLCLPAVNDKKKTISIGKFEKEWQVDELLNPTLLSNDALTELKRQLGVYNFAGQYLQKPSPPGGGIFKKEWWKLWSGDKPPKCHFLIQVYDTAFGEKETNDYTARTSWGIFTDDNDVDNIILLERFKQRVPYHELLAEAKKSFHEFKPNLVLIEAKASGQSLIQDFKRLKLPVRDLQRGKHNGGDKIARAHNVSAVLQREIVWVPTVKIGYDDNDEPILRPKRWAQEVIDECAMFPNVTHDDIVDTVIDAMQFLHNFRNI